jgi:hypothetical protein
MDPAEHCRAIYRETQQFYSRVAPEHALWGFKIFYGPPLLNPRILVIGYQPGGGAEDNLREQRNAVHERWPSQSEYVANDWPRRPNVATRLQDIFGIDLLRHCVGLNAVFFRAPSEEEYHSAYKGSIRKEIEKFCVPKVLTIASVLAPDRILFLGLGTMDLFCVTRPDLVSVKGRVLAKAGRVADRDAIGILHPTGARISGLDRQQIIWRLRRWTES